MTQRRSDFEKWRCDVGRALVWPVLRYNDTSRCRIYNEHVVSTMAVCIQYYADAKSYQKEHRKNAFKNISTIVDPCMCACWCLRCLTSDLARELDDVTWEMSIMMSLKGLYKSTSSMVATSERLEMAYSEISPKTPPRPCSQTNSGA